MDGVRLDVHPMCGIFHQSLGKCGNGSNGIFWIVWSIVLEDGSRRRVSRCRYFTKLVSDMVIYTEWNAMDIRNDVNSIIREPRIAAWMRADL